MKGRDREQARERESFVIETRGFCIRLVVLIASYHL